MKRIGQQQRIDSRLLAKLETTTSPRAMRRTTIRMLYRIGKAGRMRYAADALRAARNGAAGMFRRAAVENHPYHPTAQDLCAHEWSYTGSAYGGDEDSYGGEGRCYCCKCGADGDA
jgi:hypothetical protein